MDFTQEDYKNLLLKISENNEILNQFMKGWKNFQSEIKNEIKANLSTMNKGYLNYQKENNQEMKYNNISIRYREDKKIWYCRIRINKKQKYISSTNQQECYKKLKLAVKERNTGIKEEIKNYTLLEWAKIWLETYKIKSTKNIRETTIKDYQRQFKYLDNYKNYKLDKITNIDIINLLNLIKFERTKQKIYELLKQLFNKAKVNNLIKINPMQDIEKPKYQAKEKIILSEEQEIIFINKCKNYGIYGDFLLICLFEGLRRGECLGIKRKDIDLLNKTISINESINQGTTNTSTKNIYSNRVIPIFNNAYDILKKYENLEQEERIFNFTPRVIDKHFQKLKRELNLNITIHSLRHNFITKLAENKIQENIIQKLVGHSKDSKITSKVYTHIRNNAYLQAIEEINNKINK